MTYKSRSMKPCTKAYFVNRWIAFHKAFPAVTMKEWCAQNNLSDGTFYNWVSDPRYNKELRTKGGTPKKIIEVKAPEKKPEEKPVEDAKPAPIQKEEAKAPEEIPETKAHGNYVVFTCPDYRLEISKSMDPGDINRILGYVAGIAKRNASYSKERARLREMAQSVQGLPNYTIIG